MAIQWFPGHMRKAQREIEALLPQVDVIIEVLDARLPHSSENPLLAQCAGHKPGIKLLNKADLADPALNEQWRAQIAAQGQREALLTHPQHTALADQLTAAIRALLGERRHRAPPRALIAGIPNVGKSSLINRMAGRALARTGDIAALTRRQQRVALADGSTLIDTPGLLWARVRNEASGYRLALSGAIGANAYEPVEVALAGLEALAGRYPERLRSRYRLETLPADAPALLEAIGERRGARRRGAQIDLERAATAFIDDLRSAQLGRLTLETPSMIAAELEHTAQRERERAARRAARPRGRR